MIMLKVFDIPSKGSIIDYNPATKTATIRDYSGNQCKKDVMGKNL